MPSVTLYRKYRPQTFADIVGQDHVKATIQQEILTKQLPHAFLFAGPRGIGKTTMARVLAKALNCKDRKGEETEPCNKCEVCDSITNGKSLNLVEVDAASQTGVDNVRDNIIANAQVAVNSDEYKVFIIDEVHMLSTSSFNALLKTLEEPPERVVFVLATTEIHKIPETIISRCQRFDFHPVGADLMKGHLFNLLKQEKREVDDSVVLAIVKKSSGHVRDAVSLLGQILSLPGKITPEAASLILPVGNIEYVVAFFDHISQNKTADAMILIDQIKKEGLRPFHFCQDLIDFAHKMMLMRVGSHPDIFKGEVSDSQMPSIEEIAERYSPDQLLSIIDVLMKRRLELKNYDQAALPLELAVVELSGGVENADVHTPSPVIPHPEPQTEIKTPTQAKTETPTITKTQTEASAQTITPTKTPAQTESSTPDLPLASYDDVQPVWGDIMKGLSHDHHSLFIILRTGELRKADDGGPELAFRFAMHHDHVKSGMNNIVEQGSKLLTNKCVRFRLVVDHNLAVEARDEVEEPKNDEKEALSKELSQLADAFGGSVIE